MRRTLDELGEGDHCLLKADLQNSDEARRLVDHSVDVMDGIGIQVACAGAFEAHPKDTTILVHWRESFDRTLTVKLLAAAFATSGAACYMNDQGGSRIVNVSSRAAFRGEPGSPAYGAGKAGLNTFWLSLE